MPVLAGARAAKTADLVGKPPMGRFFLVFFGGDPVCDTSYGDRKGKYQKQVGVTLPKL